jgi:uncharacterized membrane protein YphA (DoxX/SURF4 family)
MLNLFPIQFLALFAYFILRVLTGLSILWLGHQHYQHRHDLSQILVLPIFPFGKTAVFFLVFTEVVIGTLLTIGLFTQAGAILLMLLSLKMIVLHKYFHHPTLPNRLTYLLFFAIGFSLFITGAGVFAFDLPI